MPLPRTDDIRPDGFFELSGDMLIEVLPDAVLVLDRHCQVLRVNPAFCDMSHHDRDDMVGMRLDALLDGSIPADLHRAVLSAAHDGAGRIEVDCVLPHVGPRTLQVSARLVGRDGDYPLVVVLQDVTEERALDHNRAQLHMAEVAHRVKNSLQILASSVVFQQRHDGGGSNSGFRALHRRILAIASLYDVIGRSGEDQDVDAHDLVVTLAESLRRSLLDEHAAIQIVVDAAHTPLSPRTAEAIGLVINELATNAVKHAFPDGRGRLQIGLHGGSAEGLVIKVIDDGCGMVATAKPGVGSTIVKSLMTQLKAKMAHETGPNGTTVSFALPAEPSRLVAGRPM